MQGVKFKSKSNENEDTSNNDSGQTELRKDSLLKGLIVTEGSLQKEKTGNFMTLCKKVGW